MVMSCLMRTLKGKIFIFSPSFIPFISVLPQSAFFSFFCLNKSWITYLKGCWMFCSKNMQAGLSSPSAMHPGPFSALAQT